MKIDYELETEQIIRYSRTKCTCQSDIYKICHKHSLIYCLICNGIFCPKCRQETINDSLDKGREECDKIENNNLNSNLTNSSSDYQKYLADIIDPRD